MALRCCVGCGIVVVAQIERDEIMTTIQMILVVCPLIFLASFVDAVAGGGGLISVPAYMLTGMPTHMAYGSNKFSASMGTLFSVVRYTKSGTVYLKVALISAGFAVAGSTLGANLALLLSDYALRISMTILLPVAAIFVLVNKKSLNREVSVVEKLSPVWLVVLSALIGFVLGMYDGFFGPGAGTFMILGYTVFMGFDMKTASGNAKIVNLASNVSALAVYIFAGKVYFAVAVPATLCSIAGGWVGSGLAIKNGSKFIKPVLVCVLCGLFGKIIYDMMM